MTHPTPETSHQPAAALPKTLSFQFNGNGLEYFKIWIVNILLTIVTLGIYSAWAKVRNRRYFYSNTTLDGDSFEYLAQPMQLLIGRLISMAAFIAYVFISQFYPLAGLAMMLAFLIVLPWILVRGATFNARMSAWRNVRFNFHGRIGQAAIAFIGWPLLGAISLGLLMPIALYKQQKFMIEGHSYGGERFKFSATSTDYYRIFLVSIGIMIVGIVLTTIVGLVLGGASLIVAIPTYLLVITYVMYARASVIYSSTSLMNSHFRSSMSFGGYASVFVTNSLLIGLTAGIFYPWAKIRSARYLSENVNVESSDDLNAFAEEVIKSTSGLGEEAADIFDVDLAIG